MLYITVNYSDQTYNGKQGKEEMKKIFVTLRISSLEECLRYKTIPGVRKLIK